MHTIYKFSLVTLILSIGVTLSLGVEEAFADTGFSNVKKHPGIMMLFCNNEAYTPQDCDEKYEGYGWTDRINVLIYAPGWNVDKEYVDKIGTTGNPINVKTDAGRVENIDFQETGPNTGIFMGVVKLTGQMGKIVYDDCDTRIRGGMGMTMEGPFSSHDRAVMIRTSPQDGRVTVSWEPNEDTVVIKSAYYNWNVGKIEFEKPVFLVDEPIKFVLHDKDLWKHHVEFFSYNMEVFSDTDKAGICVPVQFIPSHEHGEGAGVGYEGISEPLKEPASHSLTKFTPDGKWKLYFWWEPGGVIGVGQDYTLNFMFHEGATDLHQTDITYDFQLLLNGEIVEAKKNVFTPDGQGLHNIRFEERGSAKIIISNINGLDEGEDFSFQVAPEAKIKEVAPRHRAFDEAASPDEWESHYGTHYIDYLEGEFRVTTTEESFDEDRLRVSPGDKIYVRYHDITLPVPYSEEDDEYITASTMITDDTQIFRAEMASTFNEENENSISPTIGKEIFSNDVNILQAEKQGVKIVKIPHWIRSNAAWWSGDQITDLEFVSGIEYMIKEGLVYVPAKSNGHVSEETSMPEWLKKNAEWWSKGKISDLEFSTGIEYLIENGSIRI